MTSKPLVFEAGTIAGRSAGVHTQNSVPQAVVYRILCLAAQWIALCPHPSSSVLIFCVLRTPVLAKIGNNDQRKGPEQRSSNCPFDVHPVCTQQQVARRKHSLHSPVWCSPPVHPVCTPRPRPSSSSHPARASEDPKSAQLTAKQDQPAALATDLTEGSAHSSKPHLSVCIPSSWPPCSSVDWWITQWLEWFQLSNKCNLLHF